MNSKIVKFLVFGLAFIAATPSALAKSIPLPDHRPKSVSPETFKFVRQQLKTIKQFDLDKLGIPLEKSLRLAGGGGNPAKVANWLSAVTPKKIEPMLAWYRKHLPGWKLSDHTKGATATLSSPKHAGAKITFMRCLGGTYQLYPCGSVVRFYRSH